jgi:hypothetical protein
VLLAGTANARRGSRRDAQAKHGSDADTGNEAAGKVRSGCLQKRLRRQKPDVLQRSQGKRALYLCLSLGETMKAVCILLTADRQEMTRRAVESFRAQDFDEDERMLIIFDTGSTLYERDGSRERPNEVYVDARELRGSTIGRLRNEANAIVARAGEALIHWDSDDYSHPSRIREQLALLTTERGLSIPDARTPYFNRPGLPVVCVGYNDVLFWDTCEVDRVERGPRNEVWRYRSKDPRFVLGSSMCYWAEAWQACRFDDAPHEDQRWWRKNSSRCLGVESFSDTDNEPRLICSIHDGNTSEGYSAELRLHSEWSRVARYDNYVRERMKL